MTFRAYRGPTASAKFAHVRHRKLIERRGSISFFNQSPWPQCVAFGVACLRVGAHRYHHYDRLELNGAQLGVSGACGGYDVSVGKQHESVRRTVFTNGRLAWRRGADLARLVFSSFHMAHHRYTQDPEHYPEF
jgi:hypothetical protein